jgi:Cu(I)/Ag(I) efflux system membrane fusion protein
VDVEAGAESGGMTEIRKGIEAGQRVVVSGQFLIDSEASLKATTTRFAETGAGAATTHTTQGRVEAVDANGVMLSHGAIPTAGMGAMTMEFKLRPGVARAGLKQGSTVSVDFVVEPGGGLVITAVRPAADPHAGHGK